MFEHTLLESSPRRASVLCRIHYLVSAFAGALFESILVGVLMLVPLIYTQALPRQLLITDLHIPPPPGPPPAPPAGQRPRPAPHAAVDVLTAPVSIPPTIARVAEPPEPPPGVIGLRGPFVPGVPTGYGSGNGLIPGGAPWETGTPPPPASHDAHPQQMIRVGGKVIAAQALYQPPPAYPPLAKMARIQGTVVLQAIIGKDGAVQNLKVLSGHPLLVRAAMDAVKTWRYQPTLLNNEPVDVLTEIDVIFNLAE